MALDTGATYTLIPPEAAFSIGLDPSKCIRKIELVTGGGVVLAPIIVVPEFRAFGFKLKKHEVICHNLPPESAIEGLLGLNFLDGFKVTLDFPKNLIDIIK